MDALTFGTPILVRHFTMSEARKMPVLQFHHAQVLEQLGLNHAEFIDLCIILGCDYCGSMKVVGPVKSLDLMEKYSSIEVILVNIDRAKYTVPENFMEEVIAARNEFNNAEVIPAADVDLKWGECDADGLIEFLVSEKQFNEERVKNNIARLQKSKSTNTQGRLDTFFKVLPKDPVVGDKRKAIDQKGKGKDAKGKDAKAGKASSWGKKKK